MRLYIHGSGRTGRTAWPQQGSDNAIFTEFRPGASFQEQLENLADLAPHEPVDVLAHSLGAVPAVLALNRGVIQARRLILLEPALFDLARGNQHVEKHISTVHRAHERNAAGDLYGFWEIIRPVFFGSRPNPEEWEKEQSAAQHFVDIPLPWELGIQQEMIPASSTTVVTGNWNPEYEAIAAALSSHGARHIHVSGNAHRPQDHEHFEPAVFRV